MKLSVALRSSLTKLRRKRALALVTVLSMLTILVVLVVAILTVSSSERKNAVQYLDGENAGNLANAAINLAIGQVWEGTKQETGNSGREIWASQPGAIRKYLNNGAFFKGYKLYSDDAMVVTGQERDMANDFPDTEWQRKSSVWADLNEPIIRPDSPGDTDTDVEVIFPIVDPRAFVRTAPTPNPNIEGFSYDETRLRGARAATNVRDINARLPMPVRWLYVLKDGRLGTVNDSGDFVGVGVSATNPIVGRIAFWTDDESAKININTAGEPTHWAPPTVYHDREYNWAVYPPSRFEYQRYPGHPATVALSTVLMPNQDLDLYWRQDTQNRVILRTDAERTNIFQRKERLYEIMPKLNVGGSKLGTVPYWAMTDPLYTGAKGFKVNVSESVRERLYASVDELLFSEKVGNGVRLAQDDDPASTIQLFGGPGNQERSLERVRFFLTAHSRAPETNMFGMPRVAIWPIADESKGLERRTAFDRLIAFCSTLGKPGTPNTTSYYFRRADSTSPSNDYDNIKRNQDLLEYLNFLMGQPYPSGGIGTASFTDKYREDAPQILAQIFDYIRSTNVYDGVLAPTRDDVLRDPYRLNNLNTKQILDKRDTIAAGNTVRSFTSAKASGDRSFTPQGGSLSREQIVNTALPGHGQVVPIQTRIGGGDQMGFGRFPTLSEVGIQFICTADGTGDVNSWRMRDPTTQAIIQQDGQEFSGGRSSSRLDSSQPIPNTGGQTKVFRKDPTANPPRPGFGPDNAVQYWYSNYPPFPPRGAYGTSDSAADDDPRNPKNHPGFYPENWNATLTRGQPPLKPGQRRIQACLNLEFTAVGSSFTGIFPDFCVRITGMDRFRVVAGARPIPLFNQTVGSGKAWRPQHNLFLSHDCRDFGGSIGPTAFVTGRGAPDTLNLPADPHYDDRISPTGRTNDGHSNFDFVSTFTTVTGDRMTFQGGPMTIELYGSRDMSARSLVQTFQITFPTKEIPVPELVVLANPWVQWQDLQGNIGNEWPTEAPHWWAFNNGGALRRFKMPGDNDLGTIDRNTDCYLPGTTPQPYTPGWARTTNQGLFNIEEFRTLGRFFTKGSTAGGVSPVPKADTLIYGGGTSYFRRPGQPPGPIPGGLPQGNYSTYITPDAQGPFGQDVVVSMVPRHGDIRLIAAKKVVPASDWVPHPDFGKLPTSALPSQGYMGHSFVRTGSAESGASRGTGANANNHIVAGARTLGASSLYGGGRFEDFPDTTLSEGGATSPNAADAKKYGDFDTGLTILHDGPWINRADEGNTGIAWVEDQNQPDKVVRRPTAYFDDNWVSSAEAGEAYMTPNRMIPSPGIFGSLPTSVKAGEPWRTLLFRPFVRPPSGSLTHPGSPNYSGATQGSFQGVNPADHYLMDLFWMPVVEPYAISEPFSTAGKVNLNYQMVPFNRDNYIRRATGIYAVMKGELLQAYPSSDAQRIHKNPDNTRNVKVPAKDIESGTPYGDYFQVAKYTDDPARTADTFFNEKENGVNMPKYWHRSIDMESRAGRGAAASTLSQFDDRFEFRAGAPNGAQGLFRTASQICEIHLVPRKISGTAFAKEVTTAVSPTDGSDEQPASPYSASAMDRFWSPRAITGDNIRERPYANIYAKVTTQSNTFRVHYRAQSIRKARSVGPGRFDPAADSVTSDYRGSALIERRIDPEDARILDYATRRNANDRPLDDFYSFRVLENKRFNP